MSSGRTYRGARKRRVAGRYGDGSMRRGDLGGVHRVDEQEVGAARRPRSTRGRRGRRSRRRPRTRASAPSTAAPSAPTPGRRDRGARRRREAVGRHDERRTSAVRSSARPRHARAAARGRVCHPRGRSAGRGTRTPPHGDAVDRARARAAASGIGMSRRDPSSRTTRSDTSWPSATCTCSSPDPCAHDHRRRERARRQGRSSCIRERGLSLGIRLRVDAHRAQDGPERGRRHLDPIAEERPVLGGDAAGLGERGERRSQVRRQCGRPRSCASPHVFVRSCQPARRIRVRCPRE